MKKNVAVLILLTAILASSVSALAQQAAQSSPNAAQATVGDKDIAMLRANLREQRKEITAQNMNLTADEATKFWPIYDQYRTEAIKINDDRWALIKNYATNYNTMTDAQANDYIKRSTMVEKQLLDLRMKYLPMFEKVISAKKAAQWYQIDRRVDLLINTQLSSMIPIINTGN
jgi:Spy/CpxP family protein refolding chaperone